MHQAGRCRYTAWKPDSAFKGVNDSVETIRPAHAGTAQNRGEGLPLYQCDPIPGSAHFRTSVKTGLDIIKGLRGHTTGLAVPAYVIDAPGGGGKIPLLPEYAIGRTGTDLVLRNYEDGVYHYPDVFGNEEPQKSSWSWSI